MLVDVADFPRNQSFTVQCEVNIGSGFESFLTPSNISTDGSGSGSAGYDRSARFNNSSSGNSFCVASPAENQKFRVVVGGTRSNVIGHDEAVAGSPPWSGSKVPRAQVAPQLLSSWNDDPLKNECPALTLTDLGVGTGASVRVPNNVQPSWAVAYDKPGLLGSDANSVVGPEANGRSAFGLQANSLLNGPLTPDAILGGPGALGRGPRATMRWNDGSAARIAGSGTSWQVDFAIPGHDCQYEIWTYSGRAHLIRLLNGLRFVAGAP